MSDAADAGSELKDPAEMNSDETDETQSQAMSKAQNADTETVAPADGITDFPNMSVRQVALNTFAVLNYGEGTAYTCHVRDLTCECEDTEYNNGEGAGEVCKHLQKALFEAPTNVEMDQAMLQLVRDELDRLNTSSRRLEQVATSMESAAYTDTTETAQSAAAGDASDSGPDASAQAERLQEAFDEVIDDMQVKAHAGKVWFQTGQDTPDDWPFPGGSQTFKVVTEPDCVAYVHDGSDDWADGPHDLYEDKPGEWWKNALEPDDVDQYIGEVLN
jgi:hypothetical protein